MTQVQMTLMIRPQDMIQVIVIILDLRNHVARPEVDVDEGADQSDARKGDLDIVERVPENPEPSNP